MNAPERRQLPNAADKASLKAIATTLVLVCPGLEDAARAVATQLLADKGLSGANPDRIYFHRFRTAQSSALTFTGWLSLLSCAAVLLSTIASFSEDDRRLRLAFMCAACLWIVHNWIVGSPVAMANDALFLVSNLIGYYRFHIRPKRHLLS